MKTNSPSSTESYAVAYARLASIAEKLKNAGTTANLDEIVDDLRTARQMHNLLKNRLDVIRREVDVEVEAAGETAGTVARA